MELLDIQTVDRAHVRLKIKASFRRNWAAKTFLNKKDVEVSLIGSGKDWEYEGAGPLLSKEHKEWLEARWNEWQWRRTNGLHRKP